MASILYQSTRDWNIGQGWWIAFAVTGVAMVLFMAWIFGQRIVALSDRELVAELRKRKRQRWPKRIVLLAILIIVALALMELAQSNPADWFQNGMIAQSIAFTTLYVWFEWDTHWTVSRLREIKRDA